jgi:hypothetical protein
MSKKQCMLIGIVAALLTGVFMYAVYYFPHALAECLLWFVSTAFCFGCFYLLIALIWTKGEILPNPYPSFYLPDPYFEKKEKRDVH